MREDQIGKGEPRPAWIPETLFPFTSRFIEIDGARIHYIDEGAGPPLLLLHGNPTWSFLYRDIVRGLSNHFRCIALDYPGFGLSGAAAGYDFLPASHAQMIEQFILRLDLTDLTVMVHDWGGPIGLGVAGRHPERFRAFVIGNTCAGPVSGKPKFELFAGLAGGPIGWLAIRYFNAFVNLVIPVGVARRKLQPEIMAAYRGPFPTQTSRLPTFIFARAVIRSRAFLSAVESGLDRIQDRPALIVWGDRDIAFQTEQRRGFEERFPHHQTVVLEGAGHFIQEDAPDEIVAAIAAWWDREVTLAVNT